MRKNEVLRANFFGGKGLIGRKILQRGRILVNSREQILWGHREAGIMGESVWTYSMFTRRNPVLMGAT